jgi:biotin transport system substrate-specific component
MSAGHLVILALGWAWLAALIGPAKAYALGVAPFYVATVAKTALAVVALPLAWKLTARPSA